VLDGALFTTLPISYQSVDLTIRNPDIAAVWIGTGIALGGDGFLPAAPALDLAPGCHLVLNPNERQLHSFLAGRTVFG
jgi:hypothetical protein